MVPGVGCVEAGTDADVVSDVGLFNVLWSWTEVYCLRHLLVLSRDPLSVFSRKGVKQGLPAGGSILRI